MPAGSARFAGGIDPPSQSLLVTSRIVYMHDPSVIDSAGDGAFRWGGAYKRLHGDRAENAAQPMEVFGVCGAACLMPKAVFDELGGFDDDFFASHEDVDLSYRARLRGYRCRYVPDAIVRHHGSATLGTISKFAVFHGQRNLEWVFLQEHARSRCFCARFPATWSTTPLRRRISRAWGCSARSSAQRARRWRACPPSCASGPRYRPPPASAPPPSSSTRPWLADGEGARKAV